jgi:hypothetical protein
MQSWHNLTSRNAPQNSLNKFDERERFVDYKASNMEDFTFDRDKYDHDIDFLPSGSFT